MSALATAWVGGSALWVIAAAVRIGRFRRLLRHAEPAPEAMQDRARRLARRLGLGRCPGVWLVPGPVCPMLWAPGGAPKLLVPQALWARLGASQRDALLVHELAHLRRRDHWVRLVELAAMALYWWHPVTWWACRSLREAEEQCCDAWVVWALPGAGRSYATALLESVEFLSGARTAVPLAASGMGQVHHLKRRLMMIKRGATPRSLSSTGSLAAWGLASVMLPLAPAWAQDEPAKDAPPARTAPAAANPGEPAADAPQARPRPDPTALSAARAEVQRLRARLQAAEARLAELEARGRLMSQPAAEPSADGRYVRYRLENADGNTLYFISPMRPGAAIPPPPAAPPAPATVPVPPPQPGRAPIPPVPSAVPLPPTLLPPVGAAPPALVPSTVPAPAPSDQEKRLREVERKLDQLLDELKERKGSRGDAPPRAEGPPRASSEVRGTIERVAQDGRHLEISIGSDDEVTRSDSTAGDGTHPARDRA